MRIRAELSNGFCGLLPASVPRPPGVSGAHVWLRGGIARLRGRTGAHAAAGGTGRAVLHPRAVALDRAGGVSAAHDAAAGSAGTFGGTPTLRAADVARALALTGDRRCLVQSHCAVAATRAGDLAVHARFERALAGAGATRGAVRCAAAHAGGAPITGVRAASAARQIALVVRIAVVRDVVRQGGGHSPAAFVAAAVERRRGRSERAGAPGLAGARRLRAGAVPRAARGRTPGLGSTAAQTDGECEQNDAGGDENAASRVVHGSPPQLPVASRTPAGRNLRRWPVGLKRAVRPRGRPRLGVPTGSRSARLGTGDIAVPWAAQVKTKATDQELTRRALLDACREMDPDGRAGAYPYHRLAWRGDCRHGERRACRRDGPVPRAARRPGVTHRPSCPHRGPSAGDRSPDDQAHTRVRRAGRRCARRPSRGCARAACVHSWMRRWIRRTASVRFERRSAPPPQPGPRPQHAG